jgi:WD40 repeat protein/formylglycine-generating enzyme required for sulfatase activity
MIPNNEKIASNLGNLLLEAAKPDIYGINAFRTLEMPIDCRENELVKRQKMIDIATKNGTPIPSGAGRAFPLEKGVDEYAIRNAMERLRDPEQRFIDEFFWFWPHELGNGRNDEALLALREGNIEEAVQVWTDIANTYTAENVSIHNMAVLSHLQALDLEEQAKSSPLSEIQLKRLGIFWKQTYKRWKMLLDHQGFWKRLEARVSEFGDPRLDVNTVEEMRRMLPLALLTITANLAIQASLRNDQASLERLIQVMRNSGLENYQIDDSFIRALEPFREQVRNFCKNAKEQADSNPARANKPAWGLLEQCKPILKTIDQFLPKESAFRMTLHDEVGLRGLECTIAFGNKTEGWKEELRLLEAYLAITEGQSARGRIEENIKTVKNNLETGNRWCGDGYYDLPEPLLGQLEQARQFTENKQYDQAVKILDGFLSQKEPPLTQDQKRLVSTSMSSCLTSRSLDPLTQAISTLDKPTRIVEKIIDNIKRNVSNAMTTAGAVKLGMEQSFAQFGNLHCMACLTTVTSWYTFEYNQVKVLVCNSCYSTHKREIDNKLDKIKGSLRTANDDLLQAIELDPSNAGAKSNLKLVKDLAKQFNLDLPTAPSRRRAGVPKPQVERKPAPVSRPYPTVEPKSTPPPLAPAKPRVSRTWLVIGTIIVIAILYFWARGRTSAPSVYKAPPTSAPEIAVEPIKPTEIPAVISLDQTIVDSKNVPMVLVPEGEFQMGLEVEKAYQECVNLSGNTCNMDWFTGISPVHQVYLDAFYIDQFEVTNARYAKCVESGVCQEPRNTSTEKHPEYYSDPLYADYPVVNVDWEQARTYCEWRGGRLPTEAEWEKAARGTDGRLYPWGDTFDGKNANFCDQNCESEIKNFDFEDGYAETAPVGQYPLGQSPYGAMDMAGNMGEWVADWHAEDYYASQSVWHNPAGPATGDKREVRGGYWGSSVQYLLSALRFGLDPTTWVSTIGFRCARSAEVMPSASEAIATSPSDLPLASEATVTPQSSLPQVIGAGSVISPENATQLTQFSRWGKGALNQVAYSPDGRLVAAATGIGIYLYDSQTLAEVKFIDTQTLVTSVSFSPDGQLLAAGTANHLVQIWQTRDGALQQVLEGHTDRVQTVAFSPDGQLLASGSQDHTIRIWQVDGTLLHSLDLGTSYIYIYQVAFSPDSTQLASASSDANLILWDVRSGTQSQLLFGSGSGQYSVAFSPDGKLLASGSMDNSVYVWQVATGTQMNKLDGHTKAVNCVAFSPDGTHLASGSYDATVRLWQVSTGSLWQTLEGESFDINSVSFSPDGNDLASSSRDGKILLWQVSSGQLLRTNEDLSVAIFRLAYSPDGQLLASAGWDNVVRIWRASDGTLLKRLEGHTDAVNSVAFSPDGQLLASGSFDGTIYLWNVTDGSEVRMMTSPSSVALCVTFSSDGKLLASGSWSGGVSLWKVSDGTLLQTLDFQSGIINSISFSPDGKTMATGSSNTNIGIWETSSWTLSQTLSGHIDWVTGVAFSPDGQFLASASMDGSPRLWDAAYGTQLQSMEGKSTWMGGLAFSPDSQLLATALEDGSIRVWQVSNGILLQTLKGHTFGASSVVFSPDGRYLVSGAEDGTIQVWGVPEN